MSQDSIEYLETIKLIELFQKFKDSGENDNQQNLDESFTKKFCCFQKEELDDSSEPYYLKSTQNSDEKYSKKQPSEKVHYNSNNNDEISENKILDNHNLENPPNQNELKHENTLKNYSRQFKYYSEEKISENKEVDSKSEKPKNTENLGKKLNGTEKPNDSDKKEIENLLDNKKSVPQNQIPGILNQENSSNSKQSKQESIIKNYPKNNTIFIIVKINKNDHFLTGNRNNTKDLEKKLNKPKKLNNTGKKEKENLLDNKKLVPQNRVPDIRNEENLSNSNEIKQVNYEETFKENYISPEEIDNKYKINNRMEILRAKMKKEENFLGKKRKSNEIGEEKEEVEVKIDKEKEGDNFGRNTKIREDHLILKTKSYSINWLRKRINKYLRRKKILKMDYKAFGEIINTKKNKGFLKMTLDKIFSLNTTEKENSENYNKNLIKEIMESDNEEAKSLLKLTYKEGLDLFRYKENETNLKEKLGNKIINDIEERVEKFLLKSYDKKKEKNGEYIADDYTSSLKVIVYNFERWFSLKTPRKERKKKEKKKQTIE